MRQTLIFALLLFFTVSTSVAQKTSEKKKVREEQRHAEQIELRRLVNSRYYSLDNFQLFDRHQNTQLLSTNNNFIKFRGDDIVLQTSYSNVDGINGLGGITLQGRIIDYEISDVGKKGPLNLQVIFSTKTLGHTSLNITFYSDGTCRTQFSGYRGLEVFFLGSVESDNMSLAAHQGVPSF